MKKISLAAKLVTVAVLTVPFIYERDENGGLKLRAVLYDINIAKKEDGTKDIRIDIGGIFKDQIKAVKRIFADISASRRKKEEGSRDSSRSAARERTRGKKPRRN